MDKETIALKVSTDARWATRALLVLYDRQTRDEQEAQYTKHQNGIGFSAFDAQILSSFAQQIQQGRSLTDRQLTVAFRRLPRYARQLAEVVAERAAVQAPAPITEPKPRTRRIHRSQHLARGY